MNFHETTEKLAVVARSKTDALKANPPGFLMAAALAGAYVGIGILLIFSLGEGLDAPVRRLVMGAAFGIALTLVVFAGSELFTGHTLYMTAGWQLGRTGPGDLVRVWAAGWLGNLLGAVLLSGLFVIGGSHLLGHPDGLLYQIAAKKMNDPAPALVARAVLCNWLVCLALWTSSRTSSDTAKCVLIWWCLFAFIACGFEHSVANMTIFATALLSQHPVNVTLGGAAWNLLWVTLGNLLAGVVLVGMAYVRIARHERPPPASRNSRTPPSPRRAAL